MFQRILLVSNGLVDGRFLRDQSSVTTYITFYAMLL